MIIPHSYLVLARSDLTGRELEDEVGVLLMLSTSLTKKMMASTREPSSFTVNMTKGMDSGKYSHTDGLYL